VIGVIGMYLLYKGFGLDEFIHGIINALRASMSRGKFSFVTYSTTIVLGVIGFAIGFFTVLKYYASDSSMGVLLYVMSFMYGAITWLIVAGLVTSVGVIIDVYINERENLAKVIVFPFFVFAIGIILYGASTYILAVNSVPDFPVKPADAGMYIMYSTLVGFACAAAGAIIQYVIGKRQTEQQKEAIIETI
jgi:putative membrane protein